MNLHDIKLAIRNLKRNRLYSILSITGFAVGFAVCIFVAVFIFNELSMDKCYPNYKNTVLVYESKKKFANLNTKLNQDLREKYPEIVATCPLEQIGLLEVSAKTEQNYARFTGLISTSNDFFSVFPIKVLVSSGKQPFSENGSVVITQSFAKQLFQNEEPLGKPITIFNSMKGQISAIIEDFPKNSSLQAKVLVNINNPDFQISSYCTNGKCWNTSNHYLILSQKADRTALAKKMTVDFSKNFAEIESLDFQKLQDIYFSPIDGCRNISGNKSLMIILFSVGMVVLILSTINFLNFYVSMQYSKLKEIGIKKINGASLRHLLQFSLSEVSVSVLISVAFAIVLFLIFLPWGNLLFERNLEASLLLNPSLTIILVLITSCIILVNSIAPLSIVSKFNASSFLLKMQVKNNRQGGRRLLTILQLSVSMALIVIVFALYHQIEYVKNADLGFCEEKLLKLKFPDGFKSQDGIKQKLAELPFCQSISLSKGTPGDVYIIMRDKINGKKVAINTLYADEDFLKTLGIKIVAGRDFMSGDMDNSCIMNEEAIRQIGWENFEGKRITTGRNNGDAVIGIMKDFHIESMHEKIKPVCILAAKPEKYDNLCNISIRLSTGNLGLQMEQLRNIWKSFIPDEPMNVSFYDDQFDAMYHKDDQLSKAIGVISVIALILSIMGILGQVFQIGLNRTKEIGIRKVNGATVANILTDINKEFIIGVTTALFIATPLAWYIIDLWLENFAYKTTIGWPLYAVPGFIMLATVVLAVTLQSWKAATRNPVEALRYE